MIRVLMVCLGNICRSPSAEAVFRKKLEEAGLADQVEVDSAGTGAYHIGSKPDSRSIEHAAKRGYQLDALRARQVEPSDFYDFDFLLAMDRANLSELRRQVPEDFDGVLSLFLAPVESQSGMAEVPDPYYGGEMGFEMVLDLLEDASPYWIERIRGSLSE